MERDDEFLDSLRGEARKLRYEPDDPGTFRRIEANVRERVERAPQLAEIFVSWFRPVAAAIAAAVTIAVVTSAMGEDPTVDLAGSPELLVAMEGASDSW